jgi:hypothetical protein
MTIGKTLPEIPGNANNAAPAQEVIRRYKMAIFNFEWRSLNFERCIYQTVFWEN